MHLPVNIVSRLRRLPVLELTTYASLLLLLLAIVSRLSDDIVANALAQYPL